MYSKRKKDKILIVDDSKMNHMILADMLSEKYHVMDGFEVLEIMRRYHWSEEIPVIIISAENSHSVVERAYELGAADYISRPFDEVIVCRRVDNTIMLYAKQKRLISMVADQMYESEKSNTLMVSILSHIVEFRNGESGLHVLHIGAMTEMLLK